MKSIRAITAFIAAALFACAVLAQPFNTQPRGGTTTITSGTTATASCTAGGVLFSASNLVVCNDTDLTFNGTTLTATGLTVTNAPTFSALTATRIPLAGTAGLLGDSANLTYSDTLFNSGPGLKVGTGNSTIAGLQIGYGGTSGVGAIYHSNTTPSNVNYALAVSATQTELQGGSAGLFLESGGTGVVKMQLLAAAGRGPDVTSGTAVTDVAALSVTRTNNNAAVATGVAITYTDTSSAATFKPFHILGGSGATTVLFTVPKEGGIGMTNKIISGTAPTYASGGCLTGAGTVVTNANGTAYFTITLGTGCSGSQPVVVTLPAATTGWHCTGINKSNAATSVPSQSNAVSTTSVTITNYARTTGLAAAWTDSDVLTISCMGG